jgi:molecular chaperone DnaK
VTEPSIGIDLGTTNSAVASLVDGKPRIIERCTGQRLLPSMVGFGPEGERVIGEAARALAETLPENVAYATKRFMGMRWSSDLAAKVRGILPFSVASGPNEDVRVRIAGRTLPVVQIAAMILSELRLDAESFFGREVRRAVVTVPAAFNDAQRQATKEAAKIAGLDVLRLINEPTAAALAYGLTTGFEGRAMVFDLGGGTFDVSVLEVREGVFEAIATGGDPFLGGEDFDNAIVQWLLSQVADPVVRERAAHDRPSLQRLKAAAEQAKKAISTTEETRISAVILADDKAASLPIETLLSRHQLDELVRPKAEQCLTILDRTLKEGNVEKESIARVLMVGGMTRMPLIRRMVAEHFGAEPATNLNPDEVVAMGAAIQASELVARAGNVLLMDIVSNTLSVGIAGGACKPLIRKNTSLPCKAREVFNPCRDAQTNVRIPVLQGESQTASGNFLLGELTLGQLKGGRRSETPIEVTFDMGTDGILSVQAMDVTTGRAKSANIMARTDLPASELERMTDREKSHRLSPAAQIESGERKRNVEIREGLRRAMERARELHQELQQASSETAEPNAKAVVESVGRWLVEAEVIEQSGSIEEVEVATQSLKDMVKKLFGTGDPRAAI